jgi:hypothetical protein
LTGDYITYVSSDPDKDGTLDVLRKGDFIDTPGLHSADNVRVVTSTKLKDMLKEETNCRIVLVFPRHTTRLTEWWDNYLQLIDSIFGNSKQINIVLTFPPLPNFDRENSVIAPIKRKCPKATITSLDSEHLTIHDLNEFPAQAILRQPPLASPRPGKSSNGKKPVYKLSSTIAPHMAAPTKIISLLESAMAKRSTQREEFDRLKTVGDALLKFQVVLYLHKNGAVDITRTAEPYLSNHESGPMFWMFQTAFPRFAEDKDIDMNAHSKCDVVEAALAINFFEKNGSFVLLMNSILHRGNTA